MYLKKVDIKEFKKLYMKNIKLSFRKKKEKHIPI